ncbi:hypothetical protein H4R20_002645, partial [Coemansia guatemalensis]
MNKRTRIGSDSNTSKQRAGYILDDDDSRTDFIYVGTALPSAQKQQRHQRERQRGWDDKPKDHSRDAFKGGFTAGYFGTVGSKEGWQSSAEFVSSRTNRAQRREMKPEDFMDAEDLADQQEARTIAINRGFSSSANREREEQLDTDSMDDAAGEAYAGVVGAMAERIAAEIGAISLRTLRTGDRIMTAMGWKPGHGIGPLRRDIGQYSMQKVDKEALTLLPPQPIPLISPAPKSDYHGVGYGVDLNSLPASLEDIPPADHTLPSLGMLFKQGPPKSTNAQNDTNGSKTVVGSKDSKKGKKKQSARQVDKMRLSFGTLEDDDDDIDEYSVGKGNRNYTASGYNKGLTQLQRLVGSTDARPNMDTTQKPTPERVLGSVQTHSND